MAPKIGTYLRITDDSTTFSGGIVRVVDHAQTHLVCAVAKQPETDRFREYRGGMFTLSSHVFVRDGQYEITERPINGT